MLNRWIELELLSIRHDFSNGNAWTGDIWETARLHLASSCMAFRSRPSRVQPKWARTHLRVRALPPGLYDLSPIRRFRPSFKRARPRCGLTHGATTRPSLRTDENHCANQQPQSVKKFLVNQGHDAERRNPAAVPCRDYPQSYAPGRTVFIFGHLTSAEKPQIELTLKPLFRRWPADAINQVGPGRMRLTNLVCKSAHQLLESARAFELQTALFHEYQHRIRSHHNQARSLLYECLRVNWDAASPNSCHPTTF